MQQKLVQETTLLIRLVQWHGRTLRVHHTLRGSMKTWGIGRRVESRGRWWRGLGRRLIFGLWSWMGKGMLRNIGSQYKQETCLLYGEFCSWWGCTLVDCLIWNSCLIAMIGQWSDRKIFGVPMLVPRHCFATVLTLGVWTLCSRIGLSGAGKF